jgi:hypothetical protein
VRGEPGPTIGGTSYAGPSAPHGDLKDIDVLLKYAAHQIDESRRVCAESEKILDESQRLRTAFVRIEEQAKAAAPLCLAP